MRVYCVTILGVIIVIVNRANVVEKFREVSDSVWVSFEAVVIEKDI